MNLNNIAVELVRLYFFIC